METTLKNGLTLVQQNPDCAVDLTGGEWHGWLFAKNPADGQWVSVRKLEGWEIMQAEDQRDSGIVQHGTSVRGPTEQPQSRAQWEAKGRRPGR